jgi:hypothetical protein
MDRSSQRRIWKVEELLSAAKREREKKRKKFHENCLRHARLHATAVAAIVLSGKPKIDKPLRQAWTRALQHYGISDANEGTRIDRQVAAAQDLLPLILGDKNESARFTQIFRAAPGWLVTFTQAFIDAGLLKFDQPNILWRPKWGRAGYEESRHWPLLPSCTMTTGDPVPDEDARYWPFPLMKEVYSTEDSQKRENDLSTEADLLTDFPLLVGLMDPEKEKELSRYEKLRLRNLLEHILSFKK